MKVRSGLKDIYQNNYHPITEQSMKNFLHMAQIHLCDSEISDNTRSTEDNDEVGDVEALGIQKLKSIIKTEARKKLPSRFIWGSMSARGTNPDALDDLDEAELE